LIIIIIIIKSSSSSSSSSFIYFFSSSSSSSVAPTWSFFSLHFINLEQTAGLLGRGISPTQGRYLTKKTLCLEWDSNPRSPYSSWRSYFIT
jgi:hypothetical protein